MDDHTTIGRAEWCAVQVQTWDRFADQLVALSARGAGALAAFNGSDPDRQAFDRSIAPPLSVEELNAVEAAINLCRAEAECWRARGRRVLARFVVGPA
jgi:hypothetical protein